MQHKNRHHQDAAHAWNIMGDEFILNSNFKVVDYLGAGAYGMVCAVHDYQINETVAIKKCKKIFQSRTLAKRTLREARLLRQFNHNNIVKLKSILMPHDLQYFSDLYLIFEIMDTDLAQIIRSPQPLKEQHVQYFVYQILQGLSYLHSKHIVHRDIKPRNILVNADCSLKLADFGLARVYKDDGNVESAVAITDYVTTRWYRAPEVIVGWTSYSAAIDMWAVGCILAELINRAPLFPGENTMKQLGSIIKVLGCPSESFIIRSQKNAFRSYMMSLTHRRSLDLRNILPHASMDAVDLMYRLLNFDPSQRLSADSSLVHPFIIGMTHLISPNSTMTPLDFSPDEFAFENRKLTIEDLREEITNEINYYHQDVMYNIEHDCKLNGTSSILSRECEEEELLRDDGCDAEDGYGSSSVCADGVRSILKQANDDDEDNKQGDERDGRRDGDDENDGKEYVDDFHDVDSADHINHHHNDEGQGYCRRIIDSSSSLSSSSSSSSVPTTITRHSFIDTAAEDLFLLSGGGGGGTIIIEEEEESKEEYSIQDFLHAYNNKNNYQGNNNKNNINNHHLNMNDSSCRGSTKVQSNAIQVARRGSRSSYLSCFSSVDGEQLDNDHADDHGDRYYDRHRHHQDHRYHQPPPLESCMYQRMSGNPEDRRTKKKTDVFGSSCVIA